MKSSAELRVALLWAAAMLAALSSAGCQNVAPSVPPLASADGAAAFPAGPSPSPKILYAIATLLKQQGQDEQCEAALETLIGQNPEFLAPYYDLIQLHMRRHELSEAMQVAKAGLAIWPADDVLLDSAGVCSLIQQEYPAALAYFSRAAAAAPEKGQYRADMATALGLMGRYEESLSLYLQIVPTDEAHYQLAALCEARKDDRRAAAEYEAARSIRQRASPPAEAKNQP